MGWHVVYKFMSEAREWNEEEDRLLRVVYETSGLTKWSHIARRLQELGVKGRNGKQCRQRYRFLNIGTSLTLIPPIRKRTGHA